LFHPLAAFTLAVELGARSLCLAGGRVWAAAAWAFHAGVLAVMAILFWYPLGAAFAPFFAVERLRVPAWQPSRMFRRRLTEP
jgi:hypothetical protein